jgi:ABC-type nitrate/sulfonate/bicarbonate transport system ATPase subunit
MDRILIAEALSVTYPNQNGGLHALAEVSFDVAPQEFVCLVGPSGCGKSTLLRALAGLQQPTSGRVIFEGEPLVGPRRRIGFVFQKSNLMPWRTTLENVLLPLELAGADPAEARGRALQLIELVGLTGFENSRPRDLSGGMEQRVAIARALVHDPDMLLLDEPFGALDALTRERMGVELLRIWDARRKPVVMVTHSIPEAVFLADRVLVMSGRPGRLRADLKVPLPRPRKQAMMYDEAFGELAARVRGMLDV